MFVSSIYFIMGCPFSQTRFLGILVFFNSFRSISGFQDADALVEQCLDKAEVQAEQKRIAAEKAAKIITDEIERAGGTFELMPFDIPAYEYSECRLSVTSPWEKEIAFPAIRTRFAGSTIPWWALCVLEQISLIYLANLPCSPPS